VCCAVYLTSLRCSPAWDTIPARLLPFSILREGNFDLNEFSWLHHPGEIPYFLRQSGGGKLMSKYPIAAPLLATPIALPAVWWLNHLHVHDDDVRFRLATVVVERIAAAMIAAISVGLLYLALCRIAPSRSALMIALAYGLGTNTWATSSEALWQHGLAEMSLAGLCVFLLGADTRTNAIGASMFAALGVLARPTMAIFALLGSLFIGLQRPKRLPAFLALPVIGITGLVLYNLRSIGSVRGGYSNISFVAPSLMSLAGLLVSPNRGLFFYTPIALLAVPSLLWWRTQRAAWISYLAVGVLLYLLLYASFIGWWGGHTYGPRFLIDILPALALCAVPAAERATRLPVTRAVVVGLVMWSVGVQAIGAYCDFNVWNHTPVSVDSQWLRVWDWNDLQIVRAVRGGWHGTDLGPLLWQMMTDSRAALLRPLEPAALAGTIAIEQPVPLHFRAGRSESLTLRVTNQGTAMWPAFSDYGFLDCRILGIWKQDGRDIKDGSHSLLLPRNLAPGESIQITGRIDAPTRFGTYELDLVVVQLLNNASGIYGGAHLAVAVHVG